MTLTYITNLNRHSIRSKKNKIIMFTDSVIRNSDRLVVDFSIFNAGSDSLTKNIAAKVALVHLDKINPHKNIITYNNMERYIRSRYL